MAATVAEEAGVLPTIGIDHGASRWIQLSNFYRSRLSFTPCVCSAQQASKMSEADAQAAEIAAARKSRLAMLKRMQGETVDDDDKEGESAAQREENMDDLSEEEQMKRMMGFGTFDTSKGKKVEDNHGTAARGLVAKVKRREYKQYMNKKIIRKDGGGKGAKGGYGGGGGGNGSGGYGKGKGKGKGY